MENNLLKISTKVGEWYVDFLRNEIIWKTDPLVRVPLFDEFFDEKTYVFAFDLDKKELTDDSEKTLVKFPQLLSYSPSHHEEFVKHYGLEGIDLTGHDDRSAKMLQPALIERLSLDAVTVEIAGNNYRVDHRNFELQPIENKGLPALSFFRIQPEFKVNNRACIFLMDLEKRAVVTELGDNLIAVEIPNIFSLDPVGYAAMNHVAVDLDEAVMDNGPLKNHHVAKTMKISPNEDTILKLNSSPRKRPGRHM
jgi:hypothetical protein